MDHENFSKKIVILGATGYVGGRLVQKLLDDGYSVRACGRSQRKLKSRSWANHPNIELQKLNVLDVDSLKEALTGMNVAYYLIHSMNPMNDDFSSVDRRAAQNMVDVSRRVGLERIIYLGGLGEEGQGLSKHLISRKEVSQILSDGFVPVTTLRAAMIIGSGSASFEILRYLVEHLPIMITPKWVRTRNQPIAIRNVIEYLIGCLNKEETRGQSYDIGGADVLTYQGLMHLYAKEAGLGQRFVFPVPLLTPRLSSFWIHLVTPVPHYIARPLAEGLSNEVICRDNRITEIIPIERLSCQRSIHLALNLVHAESVVTYWGDAGEIPEYASIQEGDPEWAGGTLLRDERSVDIYSSVDSAWNVITRLGGSTGWYHATWLWKIRGFLDKIFGGVGLRRGRRHPVDIAEGDVLDFWRVVSVKKNDHLLLAAEMKLPGIATLEFKLDPLDRDTRCRLIQTARFRPKGLFGRLYWYSILPLHHYVFGGMARKIKFLSEKK